MTENLSIIGSITSITCFFIVVIGFIVKKQRSAKEEFETQIKKLEDEVTSLASQASTATQRMDIYVYISTNINFLGHVVLRKRIAYFSIIIMLAFTFYNQMNSLGILINGKNTFMVIYHLVVISGCIVSVCVIYSHINKIEKLFDTYTMKYTENVDEYIQKKYSNNSVQPTRPAPL